MITKLSYSSGFTPKKTQKNKILSNVNGSQSVQQTALRFAGPDLIDAALGAAPRSIETWAIRAVIQSLYLSSDNKRVLREHGMPNQFIEGLEHLVKAKTQSGSAREDNIREAKILFRQSGEQAKLRTFQAAGYRMAAVSAKVLGETAQATEYMDKSKTALGIKNRNVEHEYELDNHAFDQDWSAIFELQSLVNGLMDGFKLVALAPIAGIEWIGQRILGKPKDTPLTTSKIAEASIPMMTAVGKLSDQMSSKNWDLKVGEESDEEWIKGNTNRQSTGKGLRHTYI